MSQTHKLIGTKVVFEDPETGQPIVGTVETILDGTQDIIHTVRVIRDNGDVSFVDVSKLIVTAIELVGPLTKFFKWVASLFKKKKRK